MAEIKVPEGERHYVDYQPNYGPGWSDNTKRGQNVAEADVTTAYFYVKTNESDASPWLTLTSASTAQIAWVNGKLRVKLGSQTIGHAGTNYFECRLKLTDGTYKRVEKGTFLVEESITDNP